MERLIKHLRNIDSIECSHDGVHDCIVTATAIHIIHNSIGIDEHDCRLNMAILRLSYSLLEIGSFMLCGNSICALCLSTDAVLWYVEGVCDTCRQSVRKEAAHKILFIQILPLLPELATLIIDLLINL